ncbi:MAG: hypothetical protein GY701_30125, partial [Sulfitobacter sp.]|nr:hypothetical protein [Sulfitobacter sp.]
DKKGNWYNGLALVADPDRQSAAVTDRLIFGQYDGDGWMQSAFTDTLDSGQKLSGNAKDDPLQLSRPNNGYLSISSDLPLAGMQAVSYGSNLLQGGNLIPGERMSAELFFPYFARTQGWKTYFGIINAGDAAEQVRLISHGQYGELTGDTTMELQAGEKIEYDTLTMSVLSASARSMRAQTTSGRSSLIGYILFWNPSFGAMGRGLIPLPLATASALEIPHVVQDGVWWTGLAAMNTTAQTINAQVEGYDVDGELVSTGLFTFRPYQQLALLPRELFDASDRDLIVRVRIKTPLDSDAALCGYMLYGTNDARMLAGLAIEPALDNTRLCVPHVISSASWWTGLALANTGESDDEVTFSLYDQAGGLLGQVDRQMAAGSRQIHLLGSLFATETAVLGQYLVVESGGGQPLSGLYLIGSADGGQLTGDAMIPLR